MVELHDVSVLLSAKPQEIVLLGNISAAFAPGEVVAVVGPPGSGKSMLLKVLAGLRKPTFGKVAWCNESGDPAARPEIAYLPQSPHSASGAHKFTTVAEQVQTALKLRVAGLNAKERREQVAVLLEKAGLGPLAEQRLGSLTPSQMRQLDLATELAGSPSVVLCDESAVGFDPKTERNFAELLHTLAREESLGVVHATHALESLEIYDSVLVLNEGQLAFHGSPEYLLHYFQIQAAADLYEQLATRRPDDWHRSWIKHGKSYRCRENHEPKPSEPVAPVRKPRAFSQFWTLLWRRWRMAWRDGRSLGMHLALLFGLPFAIAFFATGDLPRLQELSEQLRGNVVEHLKENALFAVNASRGVALVTGLAMAQALLLGFMAVQNAAREIAGERTVFEREKYRGLQPKAYVASKVAFLLPWVLAQSAWMGWYIQRVCQLPGNLWMQITVLTLINTALTSLCLAISSLTRVTRHAVPICLCLATLQLPLSGVVLAPPDAIAWMLRPLGTLYWGAGAYLESMQGTRFYEVLQVVTPFPLSPPALCIAILVLQAALGLACTIFGCKIARLGVARKPFGI